MDIKKIVTQRFIKIAKHIKKTHDLDFIEIAESLKMHKNAISNLITQSTRQQNRYVSTSELYYAYTVYKVNPMYLLSLSDTMFLNNLTSLSKAEEPQSEYGNRNCEEEIKTLKKMIEDKDEIIRLQKSLLSTNSKKYKAT